MQLNRDVVYTILCESIEDSRTKYLKTLEEKINKIKIIEPLREHIYYMLNKTRYHLQEEDEVEGNVT